MSASPAHFWLRLYQLEEALEAASETSEGRVKVVLGDLRAMPPELQQQSLRRLELLSNVASAIADACKSPAGQAK
jgi:thioester reductase-like protein